MTPKIAQAAANVISPTTTTNQHEPGGKVCIIIRTYEEQMHNVNRLEHLMKSLVMLTYRNWEAIILPTEDAPIPKLYSLLAKFNSGREGRAHRDPHDTQRFRVVRLTDVKRKVAKRLHPRFRNSSASHSNIYEQTDDAIRHCSPDAWWLLITNGDNLYHPTFFDHLDARYDLIAYDFYSR